MANKASSSKSKSMDISKPGDSKPDSSARPIIVTNRPIIQDPMVVEKSNEKPVENQKPTDIKTKIGGDKVIEPLNADNDSKQEENSNDKQKELKTPQDDNDNKPESTESAVVDAVLNANKPTEKTDQQLDAEEMKKKQEIQVLIASKKYNLPLGKVTHAKRSRNFILLLTLIILFAGALVLIDKKYLKVPFDLPFTIFNKIT